MATASSAGSCVVRVTALVPKNLQGRQEPLEQSGLRLSLSPGSQNNALSIPAFTPATSVSPLYSQNTQGYVDKTQK